MYERDLLYRYTLNNFFKFLNELVYIKERVIDLDASLRSIYKNEQLYVHERVVDLDTFWELLRLWPLVYIRKNYIYKLLNQFVYIKE